MLAAYSRGGVQPLRLPSLCCRGGRASASASASAPAQPSITLYLSSFYALTRLPVSGHKTFPHSLSFPQFFSLYLQKSLTFKIFYLKPPPLPPSSHREELDSGQSVGMRSDGERLWAAPHSQPYNTPFMRQRALYYLKRSPGSIRSHCQAPSQEPFPQKQKIVLFVKC